MNKKLLKPAAAILALLMLLTLAVPVFASDDTSGSWAKTKIEKWKAADVFVGYPDGSFKPERSITRAEFAVVVNRLFRYLAKADLKYTDVQKNSWYDDVASKVTAAGVMAGSGNKFRPDDPITRQEAAVVLYKAFDLKVVSKNAFDKFKDAKSVTDWAKDAMNCMVEKSYMSGRPGNLIAPEANITRAECVALVDNIAGELKNKAGIYSGTAKNLVVNTRDVTLKNMTISGDLYLTQGIGDGNVTLDNVTVKGRTIVRGGGEHSIVINNSSLSGGLVIIKQDGKIRIVAQGSTNIPDTQLNSGGSLVGSGFGNVEIISVGPGQSFTLDGDFGEVSLETPNVNVTVPDGSIGTLHITDKAAGAKVNIYGDVSVTTLITDAACHIMGGGTITAASINAANVIIDQMPATADIAAGISAMVGGTLYNGKITVHKSTGTTSSTTSSSGSTSGSPTPVTISNAAILLTSGSPAPSAVNISGNSSSARVTGIRFTTNVNNSSLTITRIRSDLYGPYPLNKTKLYTGSTITISVSDLLDSFISGKTDVSVSTLRMLFGNTITIEGTLSGTGAYSGYTACSTPVTLTLGTGITRTTNFAGVFTKTDMGANTTKLTPINGSTKLINVDISDLMVWVVGSSNIDNNITISSASANNTIWYNASSHYSDFVAAFVLYTTTVFHKQYDQITLGDLMGREIYYKLTGSNTVYTIQFHV